MSGKLKNLVFTSIQGILIGFVVILLVCPLSCKLTAEGIDIIKGDCTSPEMSQCLVVDDRHLELDFSENVKLSGVSISEKIECEDDNGDVFSSVPDEGESLSFSVAENNNQGKIVIGLDNSTKIGSNYVISGVVEDPSGNSLTFSAPFSGYNGRIPRMIITEVQNESAPGSKKLGLYRGEFVRLLSLDDGNLFGLVLGSASKPEENYAFPAIEVSKGESIVVHLQNKGNGCISENGDDLNLAFNDYSENGVRDLWRNVPDSILGNSCDVIYLKDTINKKTIYGIVYSDGKKTEWADNYIPYVKELAELNIFNAEDINNACNVKSVTSLNTLKRKNIGEIENKLKNNEPVEKLFTSKDDWSVSKVKSGMTKK